MNKTWYTMKADSETIFTVQVQSYNAKYLPESQSQRRQGFSGGNAELRTEVCLEACHKESQLLDDYITAD